MAETKRKERIYISIPITDRDYERQRKRAEELAHRLRCAGFEPVSPFAIGENLRREWEGDDGPSWVDFMAEDFKYMLDCDGILVDADTRGSHGCAIELAVAQVLAKGLSGRRFTIYHTKEQWQDVKNRYII